MLIKKDFDAIRSYLEDSSNIKNGNADEVVIPENCDELSCVVKDAYRNSTPITISGGGTGTTGSRVPFGGIVISMERFDRIHSISVKDFTASVETGVVVDRLKDECDRKDLFYTSHPTEKTASVGGTVATNASGARSFKYGPTRKYVKALKMVLPTGELLTVRRGERIITCKDPRIVLPNGAVVNIPLPSYKVPDIKNSAGYFAKDGMDLIDLFIGQEGTLSIITDIELGLGKMPEEIFSCIVFFKKPLDAFNFSAALRSFSEKVLPEHLSALDVLSIEYFDSNALRLLRKNNENIPSNSMAAIFFELETDSRNEKEHLDQCLELMHANNVSLNDTWVAMTEKDAERFTKFRHSLPEQINDMVRLSGFQKTSTDLAVPVKSFPEMEAYYRQQLTDSGIEHVVFGHIGECHLHVNLLPDSESQAKRAKEICLAFAVKAISLGGTISAEHGVGKTKHAFLERMYGESGVRDMVKIKKAFDPHCILGLDNIFPRKLLNDA